MLLVIRGHLILEHVLISFIQTGLSKSSALKIDRLNFPAKTELAIAMGLLPEDLSPVLLYVNNMRNNFAHDLNFKISPAVIEEFFKKFPKQGQEILLQDDNGSTQSVSLENIRFASFFEVLFVLLDLTRHHYTEWLQHKIEAENRLHDAVTNLKEVMRTTDQNKLESE